MKIDEWFFDRLERDSVFHSLYWLLSFLWFTPHNFIFTLHYRIFVRGMCAIKGCDVHYSCGGYLPDDVCEWYCKRCQAEGINQVVYTHEILYSDSRLRNFILALEGK